MLTDPLPPEPTVDFEITIRGTTRIGVPLEHLVQTVIQATPSTGSLSMTFTGSAS